MATTYTQTIEFNVWKEHTCSCCGTLYRYLFKRKMTGEGNTPEKAAQNAEKAVERALEKEVDMRPCPECGHYQPDMIASQRSTRHWWAFWAGTPIIGLLLILVLTDIMSFSSAGLIAAVSALGLLAAHFFIAGVNPNANREANRKLARRLEKDGDLWVPEEIQPRELSDEPVGTGVSSGHYLCLGMIGLSALAFLLPFALRILLGMPTNPGWYPEVAGPGDNPYIYFKDSFSSVKGYWSGQPRVTVINANELGGPISIAATAKQDSWGNTISVKSSQKNSSFKPWVRVQIPADPKLAGKTLQLRLDMSVQFPKIMGANMWQPETQAISQTVSLTLGAPGRGSLYKSSFWIGFLGGSALLFLGAALLPVFSAAFAKQAHPTSIFVPEGQLPESEGEEDVDDVESDEEAYDDDRPQKRGIRAREDDERSTRRRSRDDDEDDYDDRPRSRSRRDDDEDDYDDRPRKRRRDD